MTNTNSSLSTKAPLWISLISCSSPLGKAKHCTWPLAGVLTAQLSQGLTSESPCNHHHLPQSSSATSTSSATLRFLAVPNRALFMSRVYYGKCFDYPEIFLHPSRCSDNDVGCVISHCSFPPGSSAEPRWRNGDLCRCHVPSQAPSTALGVDFGSLSSPRN